MKSSEPLFDRMIAISSPSGVPYKNPTEAEQLYKGVSHAAKCCFGFDSGPFSCVIFNQTSVDCLRNRSTEQIQQVIWRQ